MPCVHVYNMFQSAVKYFDMGFESVSCWLFLVWGVFIQREIHIRNIEPKFRYASRYAIRYPTFFCFFFARTYSMAVLLCLMFNME